MWLQTSLRISGLSRAGMWIASADFREDGLNGHEMGTLSLKSNSIGEGHSALRPVLGLPLQRVLRSVLSGEDKGAQYGQSAGC